MLMDDSRLPQLGPFDTCTQLAASSSSRRTDSFPQNLTDYSDKYTAGRSHSATGKRTPEQNWGSKERF